MTKNWRYLLFVVTDVCVAAGAGGGGSVCGCVSLLLIFLLDYMIAVNLLGLVFFFKHLLKNWICR